MPERSNEALGVSFRLPDRLTVRQQLAYYSARLADGQGDQFAALWRGALALVEDWRCESLPDPRGADLDALYDPRITGVVLWTGTTVSAYVRELEAVPKA